MRRVRTLSFSHGPTLKRSWAHLACFVSANWRIFVYVCVCVYIYIFFFYMGWVCACTLWTCCKSFRWPQRAGPHSFPVHGFPAPWDAPDPIFHWSGFKTDREEPAHPQDALHKRPCASAAILYCQQKKSVSLWCLESVAVRWGGGVKLGQVTSEIWKHLSSRILRGLKETSSVMDCQLLVCHRGGTGSFSSFCSKPRLSGAGASSSCLPAISDRPPCCKHGHVHDECSIRQTSDSNISSLSECRIRIKKKKSKKKIPPLLKLKTWFDNFLQMHKCHFLQMNTSNQFNFSNKMIKLLLLWNHYFIAKTF